MTALANIRKIVLCGVAAGLALIAFVLAAAGAMEGYSPALRGQLPFGARTQLRALDISTTMRGTGVPVGMLLPLVRHSLATAPLDAVALRMLALSYGYAGQDQRSLQMAILSERISRRELGTQIFLIEDAVRHDDLGRALDHYDKTLRFSAEGRSILFPILSSAIADPGVRAAMIPYAAQGAPWMPEFIRYAAGNARAAAAAGDIIVAPSVARNRPLQQEAAGVVMARLVQSGDYRRARRLLLVQEGASREMIENASFTPQSIDPRFGVMAWQPVSNANLTASFASGGSAPQANIYAGPGGSGPLLTKLLFLPAGTYRWLQHSSIRAKDTDAMLRWIMVCANQPGTPIWSSENILSSPESVHRPGPIVPNGCNQQILSLTARAGDGQQGIDLSIVDLRIAR